jgi:hypothetical protein
VPNGTCSYSHFVVTRDLTFVPDQASRHLEAVENHENRSMWAAVGALHALFGDVRLLRHSPSCEWAGSCAHAPTEMRSIPSQPFTVETLPPTVSHVDRAEIIERVSRRQHVPSVSPVLSWRRKGDL